MVTSNRIRIQWEPVDCKHRNGDITGYRVRYGEKGSSEGERNTTFTSGGMTTLSGLTRGTLYTVEVAAVTRGGTGIYSKPLILATPKSKLINSY